MTGAGEGVVVPVGKASIVGTAASLAGGVELAGAAPEGAQASRRDSRTQDEIAREGVFIGESAAFGAPAA